jgi:DNA-binding CsgD family transcriptional regulator
MGKSDLLRVQDVRDAYRLIGECRDLGADPAAWHRHMFEGLCRLIGSPAATGGEGLWHRPLHAVEPLSAFDAGLDARAHERYVAFMREVGPAADPIFAALQRIPGRLVTVTRPQLVPDAIWYRSRCYNEYRRVAGADHALTSVYETSAAGGISVVCLQRTVREQDFSPRQQRLLNFFHGELGPLVGHALVSVAEPIPAQLSPRLRQTLACLLEGDSEKQVAARLELSQATTHQYVTMLYRRFSVRSRAQLLAYVLRRVGDGRWRLFLAGSPFHEPTTSRPHDDPIEATTKGGEIPSWPD